MGHTGRRSPAGVAYIVLTVLLWLAVAGGVAYAFAGGDTAGWFMRAFGIVLVLFLFNGLAKLLFVLFGYIGRRTGRGRAMGITAAVCCTAGTWEWASILPPSMHTIWPVR